MVGSRDDTQDKVMQCESYCHNRKKAQYKQNIFLIIRKNKKQTKLTTKEDRGCEWRECSAGCSWSKCTSFCAITGNLVVQKGKSGLESLLPFNIRHCGYTGRHKQDVGKVHMNY